MNPRSLAIITLTTCIVLVPCRLSATTADFEFLNQEFAARGTGLGGAFTALANDSSAAYWNPAGLASLKRSDLCLTHSQLPQDSLLEAAYLALPMGWLGSYGLGFFYRSYGEFEQRDEFGALLPGKLAPRSLAFSLSYATNIRKQVSFGISFKVASEKLAYKNRSFLGGDLGLLTRPFQFLGTGRPFSLFKLGLTVRNLGTTNSDFPAPLLIGVGLSYQLAVSKSLYLFPAIDYHWRENLPANIRLGVETHIRPHLFLRGGYAMDENSEGGLAAGMGVDYSGLRLDYAYNDHGVFGAAHSASLTLRFKPLQLEKPGKKQRKRKPRRVKRARPKTTTD
jgi:hypothetical protein